MSRRIFVGDVQGCRAELERLLEAVALRSRAATGCSPSATWSTAGRTRWARCGSCGRWAAAASWATTTCTCCGSTRGLRRLRRQRHVRRRAGGAGPRRAPAVAGRAAVLPGPGRTSGSCTRGSIRAGTTRPAVLADAATRSIRATTATSPSACATARRTASGRDHDDPPPAAAVRALVRALARTRRADASCSATGPCAASCRARSARPRHRMRVGRTPHGLDRGRGPAGPRARRARAYAASGTPRPARDGTARAWSGRPT